MSGLHISRRALVVVIAAVAVAGCGSSSKSSTGAQAPPTPSTPSTPATTGTGTTPTPLGGAAASLPLTSSQAKAALVKAAGQIGATSGEATKFVDCVTTQLEAEGIKTVGDAQKAAQSKITAAAKSCNSSLGLHLQYQKF